MNERTDRNDPLVSVVIPTYRRPDLLRRAVASVLEQTHDNLELFVMVDGDEESGPLLEGIEDVRLQIVRIGKSVGAAVARNLGAERSSGEWIAFLDDDDEWLPQKLEMQLGEARRSGANVLACRATALTPKGAYVWPRRLPSANEPFADYLFVRSGLFQGEALFQTSTMVVARPIFEKVRFDPELRRHQDWDWVLRAVAEDDVRLVYLAEELVVLHVEERRSSISKGTAWRDSLMWARASRRFFTDTAFASFLLVTVGPTAAASGERRAFFSLLTAAIREGSPRPIDLVLYLGMWLVPVSLRRSIRRMLTRSKASQSAKQANVIVQFMTQEEAGGAQRVAVNLGQLLSERGYETSIIAFYLKRSAFESGTIRHLTEGKPRPASVPSLFFKLVKTLRAERPFSLIAHTHYANIIGCLAAALARVPQRVAVHHLPMDTNSRVVQRLDALLGTLGVYTHVVCVSEAIATSLRTYPDGYRQKVRVIYNGLAKSEHADPLPVLNRPENTRLLVNVGRLSAQKNQSRLLSALKDLPNCSLAIAGEGELRADLEEQIRELDLGTRVTLLGEVKPSVIRGLIEAADLFVFPSLAEGMPLALLEAMGYGAAVVASSIAANTEVLGPRGEYVDPVSVDGLADSLRAVLDDPGRITQLREVSRSRGEAFTLKAFADGYDSLLKEQSV